LNFTGAGWPLPQKVTIAAISDHVFEPLSHKGTMLHTATSADTAYLNKTQSFKANITDIQQPAPFNSTVNVAYGTLDPLQKLDIHKPKTGTNFPVVLYIHGGQKDKGVVKQLAPIHAIDSGWAVVSINYRKVGGISMMTMQDVKAAIRFVRNKATQYNLDTKMVVWGTSGGAQMSSLVATSCGDTQMGTGVMAECPTAVTSWFGVTDLSRFDQDYLAQGCPPGQPAQTDTVTFSPMRFLYITPVAKVSPLRVENGTVDCVVPYAQAVRMDSAYTALGVKSALQLYVAGHNADTPFWRTDSVYTRTLGWIGKAFRGQL
jgi:acetyl esterase/lipase